MRLIRSVTTERADTLRLAVATSVWQFRPSGASAFRVYQIVMAWARPRLERPLPGSS